MLKSYEDGMTKGADGVNQRSTFALNGKTPGVPEEFPKVSLSDTNPINITATHKGEGDSE